MLIDKTEIVDLIPQKEPMVQVSGILENSEKHFISQMKLSTENIFCTKGYYTEPGLIENIAQTAALKAGYLARQEEQQVKVGFIGAVKKMRICQLPKDDDMLKTIIRTINEIWNVSIISGEVFVGDKLMAEAELSIFTQEESS